MPEQLVLHKTKAFSEPEFTALLGKANEWLDAIPEPDALSNSEMKALAKMGDVKEEDAIAKVESLKVYNSFLPPELLLVVIIAKLASYQQPSLLEAVLTKIINKFWVHGVLGGVDLLKMLALVEKEANNKAAYGNTDAITKNVSLVALGGSLYVPRLKKSVGLTLL
jgi:hypothetical protein